MRKIIEEAALRYAAQQVNHSDEFEDMAQVSDLKFSANDLTHAFEAGSDFALTHQWRSVEDEEPPIGKLFFCRDADSVALCVNYGKNIYEIHNGRKCRMPYWCPIPSLNPEQR